MVRQATRTSSAVLILVAALHAGAVSAHGNESLEEDSCVRRSGETMVHFSAYQPQFEPTAQYCTEIPKEGDTFLVVDLVDQALREMPVAVRIVKGNSEAEDQTVAYLRPSYHPDGVVRGEAKLGEGPYTMIITAEGQPPLRYQYPLRVQMVDYGRIARMVVLPLAVILLFSLLAYKLMKSKWMQNRRSSRRP